jgi:hypothetical protein
MPRRKEAKLVKLGTNWPLGSTENYDLLFNAVKEMQARDVSEAEIVATFVNMSAILAGLFGGTPLLKEAIDNLVDWQQLVESGEKKFDEEERARLAVLRKRHDNA